MMLGQIGLRSAACLRQLHRGNTFKAEVRHIKQFGALNNNKTTYEDFETLAADAGENEILDEFSESELVYFGDDQQTRPPKSPKSIHSKPPLRQALSYTNKALYGPLLETSAERKRKKKILDDQNETKHKTKRNKPKKNKPVLKMDPLISKPENAHFLGIFPGDESKHDKLFYHKVKIDHQNENASFSGSRDGTPRNKILLFKKTGKKTVKYESVVIKETPRIQKILVSSWKQNEETQIPPSSDDSTADECQQVSEGDILSESKAAENVSSESSSQACNSSGVQTGDNQKIDNLQSVKGNSSLISVDNAKFTSAPNIIDIEMMESFPLERTESPRTLSKIPENTDENIVTIGMFDDGYQRLPSVSKILEATMPEDARRVLEKWKAKMIKELGEEGFEEYRKGLFEKGKLLHGCIQSELTGTTPALETMPTVQGAWTSISHVLPKISNVSVLESRLVHPYLYYQGAVDCIAVYKGMPVLIDWKTSTKPKLTLKSMYDNPLQVVAYLGAFNYDKNYQFPHQVQSAMLVVAYDSGLPAHVHVIDKTKCQAYWKVWCSRLAQFWRQLQVKESE